ncbi:MAG: mechanosensitive ion channel [Lachnospiraceae bacterium]|jgi:small conductance mechanosensitive channel|nr:mechanosensitive ion channel [Lachnospiraceae bacterium]
MLFQVLSVTEDVSKEAEKTVDDANQVITYLSKHVDDLIQFAIKVLIALACFFIGRIIIKYVVIFVKKALIKASIDTGVSQFTASLTKTVLYILLIFSIATKFGFDTASVAAILASAGLALGLALQGSLSNLAGGVLILLMKPFKVGDYIIEDTHGNEGTVEEIKIIYTKLITIDNKIIVIPNGVLSNSSLTNVSTMPCRKLDLMFCVSNNENIENVKKIIRQVLDKSNSVKKDDEINIYVAELLPNGIKIGVRFGVYTKDYFDAKGEILQAVKEAFDSNDIKGPAYVVANYQINEIN